MKLTGMMFGLAAIAAFGVAGRAQAQDVPYCREYQRKVTVGGKIVDSYGTACMQPDGSWKLDSGDLINDISQPVYSEPVQVAYAEPLYVQRQVVYSEPVYSSYQYYSGPSWGMSLNWSDRDGWGSRGRGRDWHGGGRGNWHDRGHRH